MGFSQVKQFDFSWSAVAGAEYYQLLERPNGDANYGQVGGDIIGESISVTMPVHLRLDASYILRACGDGAFSDSEPVEVLDSVADAVGYFKASNSSADDRFGRVVAISGNGNTLAVSAGYDDSVVTGVGTGAVYVFVRVNEVWSQQAYLKGSNTEAFDGFGGDLALSADGATLAVGAFGEDSAATGVGGDQTDNSAPGSGAVYVFVRANDAWSQQAYLKAANTGTEDMFGGSLGMSADGDTLAVGAEGEDSAAQGVGGDPASNFALGAGAAYVFVRANAVWSQEAYLKASNTGVHDRFGSGIAVSGAGTTIAVSAAGEDSAATGVGGDQGDDSAEDAGAVYVFRRGCTGWSQEAYLKGSDTDEGDWFGTSVAMSEDGNRLAVGAPLKSHETHFGSAYMFARANKAWSQEAYFEPTVTVGPFVLFGNSVTLSADSRTLAVGAVSEQDEDETNDESGRGAAYVFVAADKNWSLRAHLLAPHPNLYDELGGSVSLSADGNILAVGASGESSASTGIGGDQTDNSAKRAGAVYLF